VRSTITWSLLTGGLLVLLSGGMEAQGRRKPAAFQPERRLFGRLFTGPRIRVPPPLPAADPAERQRSANRNCAGCEERPGTTHFILDSPRLTTEWLSRHAYQSNGGSFGDNMAVADFWYDAVHRRVFSRSLVLHEVDDPADLRLGRAPGTYPNEINASGTLQDGTTVGHVGFVSWTHNGFGSYFAAVQGAIRDSGSGYLDLATATGRAGTSRSGSTYDAQELVKHVRLQPSGQLEIGFDTDPTARPDRSLVVHGHAVIEGALAVGESLTIAGGTVLHSCSLRSATSRGREAAISCEPGQIAISGGGACASGELRGTHPTQSGGAPDGWTVACSRDAAHTAYAICCVP
jgi:hypothetical protein